MQRLFYWAGLFVVCSVSLEAHADLYRYIDNRGVTVLDSRVPTEFVRNGYEVLDSHGRVKLVVPAAPTAEELDASRAAQAEQERQAVADATLLRLYSDASDLDRAHARQVAQIDSLIATSRVNLQALKGQREELERQAAAQERAGRKVDERILTELGEVAAESKRLNRLIEHKRAEIDQVNAGFAAQRDRLIALTERSQP